ncbi:hypothetical protein IGI37_001314 [Enterococcus sp. AZ194]|uniref:ROK family protein n=1 Tax=Enterococcus sp. AZ194 TaxID=2774629 RepID=UPI003F28F3C6
MVCLAIDLGDKYLKTAIYTQFTKQLIEREQFGSPETWDKMRRLIDACIMTYMGTYEVSAISFSISGRLNQTTGQIDEAPILNYLEGVKFQEYFSEKYSLPIFMENQTISAGTAEIILGIKDEQINALFLKIDSAVSGAIFNEGKTYQGMHQQAGSFGKILLDGKREFNELASLSTLVNTYSQNKEKEYTVKEIFQLSEEGDTEAAALYEELFHYVALGIYTLQVSFDPEWIILGGEIAQEEAILDAINRKLITIVNRSGGIIPQVRLSTFSDEASLLGAGVLATK